MREDDHALRSSDLSRYLYPLEMFLVDFDFQIVLALQSVGNDERCACNAISKAVSRGR
jgi:hypothetical protein